MAVEDDDTRSKIPIAQAGLAAFNDGDYERAAGLLHPDIEWDTASLLPDGGINRGRDELLAYWRDVGERWDELRIEPEEWIEGDGAVVMLGRLEGRGAGSGVPVEGPWHQVWRFEGELPIRCENFSDRGAALRAGGVA
jgi:ketosteroid isomerase-like protein